jgi:tubulin polyglutamylase TTLL6/13
MMHLTNYAINKESDDFVANENAAEDDVGHKRSLTAIFKIIDEQRLTNNELITSKQCW